LAGIIIADLGRQRRHQHKGKSSRLDIVAARLDADNAAIVGEDHRRVGISRTLCRKL